jgi:predicted nucleic acid-binding protein
LILYLDTSSLVKLYVDEPGSADVIRLLQQADIAATSVVAYPEARAALARRRRERSLSPAAHRRARAALDADWPRILSLEVAEPLARRAGDLADTHRLRGFDALHLAAYLNIAREFPGEDVRFSSADKALVRAARRVRTPRRRRRQAHLQSQRRVPTTSR